MTNEAVAVPEITVARYVAPPVSVKPVPEVISSGPIEGRMPPGHYQHVLLNTATGELSFHESTEHLEPWDPAWKAVNDVPREIWKRWHPGTGFTFRGPHMWFEPVPELLCWTIDSGVTQLPYLDAEAANALLEELAAYAQAMLAGFFEAGGELDWSADSARAGRNIGRLCSRHRQAAAAEVDAELVDFAVIVRQFPRVYQPELLRTSLDKLAKECEFITRFLGSNEHWHREIKKVFGVPYSDGSGVGLDVLGVRSWYRTVLLDGDPRALRDFADWDAEQGSLAAGGIASASTDAELDSWADREEARAARANVRLLGVQEAAYSHRAQLREQDWDRLAVVGAEVARIERELAKVRSDRLELVTKAIGWGRSDSDIAERARMSRQAVYKIRNNEKE
jgi:hypothetical protein